jgi:hypothetical protein
MKSSHYRKIYEQHHGKIPKGYHIHHKDGNRNNNSIENLVCLSPEEHFMVHKNNGDMLAIRGKFIQKASEAGKLGGSVKSEKKIKSSRKSMLKNRCAECGAEASVKSRRKNKTFFFSEEYQKELQERLRKNKLGPYSEEHRERVRQLGLASGKRPQYNGKTWNSSYEASKDTSIPESTIRYRCRNNIKGWTYSE